MSYRRVQSPERLHSLLDAIMLIEADLDLEVLLQQIVRTAAGLVGATYGALAVLAPDGERFSQFITFGLSDEERARIGSLPQGRGLLGEVVHAGRTIRSLDLAREPESVGFPANHPPMTTFLGVPVRIASGETFGNLYLTDKRDGTTFNDEDTGLVEAFGRAAGLVVDQSRHRATLKAATLLEERERIARDLHDTVIQRLFAVGLSLQTALYADLPAASRERVSTAIDDLDTTIREIRTTIFEIGRRHDAANDSLRARLLSITDEVPARLGLPVDVAFDGPLDTLIGPRLNDHAANTLRELLSNVVRHANAQHVAVAATLRDGRFTLTVDDDGVGPRHADGFGRGLANLEERAADCAGGMMIEARQPQGTRVTWWATNLE